MKIAELKSEVGIDLVLEHYGWWDDTDGGHYWDKSWQKTLCPFHDDNEPSGSVNLSLGLFNCFTCFDGHAKDIIDIVKEQEKMSTKEAMTWIEQHFLQTSHTG